MERRKRKQIKSEIVKEVEEELEEKEVEEEVEKNNRTKRSRRSSTSQQVTVDDEEEDKETKSNLLNHFLPGCHNYHIQIPTIQLKQQQSIKWDRVSSDAAKGLAKSAARVLLFKGGHGDRVTMEHIRSSLGDYKQLTRPALKAAQQLLRNIFGLDVVLTKEPDNIYVVNTIQSPALRRILAGADRDAGYRGFCFAVFVCIWTSPGRKIDAHALLRNIRKIDPRFAETSLETQSKKDSSGIEELNNATFLTLVARMVKDGYIKEMKDDLEAGNIEKRIYEFGPRFYLEVGMKQLAAGYFLASNLRVDENLMAEIDQLGDGVIIDNTYDDVDQEGGEEEKKDGHK